MKVFESHYAFLAFNDKYELYANCEYVYLKDRTLINYQQEYDKRDICIAWVYGNPTGALIVEDVVIIAGFGINLYHIKTKKEITFFEKEDNKMFTWGLHQYVQGYSDDDLFSEVRFFSHCDNNIDKVCLYKFDFLTEKLTKMAVLDEVTN